MGVQIEMACPVTRKKVVEAFEILPPETKDFSYDFNSELRPLTATEELHAAVQVLYDELNLRLMVPYLKDEHGNLLGPVPECILTVQSSGRCKGFMAGKRWSDDHGRYLDQVTIVLENHVHADMVDVCQTLAHEMIHVAQHHWGDPGKGNYHNRQFSRWMESIGLQTSQTGKPDGKEIGTGMSDYIIPGGPFERIVNEIVADGFKLPWETVWSLSPATIVAGGKEIVTADQARKPKDPSKVKFVCPACGQIARAKQSANLLCGHAVCGKPRMVAQI